ncbi:hypothetical protein [uncultured Roseobacter sp.]|uniref:hypothetical protein n=1 Tax=uncultured Roseobacter sp. TaxID=114847 RepID=UPI0026203076|nr:hypothetical protein [uncultured Roseobacter sp.]
MTLHTPDLAPDDKLLRNEEELRRARGILADAPHHTDAEIKTAVDAILTLTRDGEDIQRAKYDLQLASFWADILARDP